MYVLGKMHCVAITGDDASIFKVIQKVATLLRFDLNVAEKNDLLKYRVPWNFNEDFMITQYLNFQN